ncbi:hypothetical protein L1987_51084 [Smallanthus sonchifolius]|uniref:Uncharacterized protein n=1 Tax=Smallanthus sonchifolius TaxID=185202 RepID=A0ACB9EPR2_9ASTR|nr:hypothetical protein L1987_51084 [Smallanthus sonchifolius]
MAAGAGLMFFPESPLAGDLLALTLSTCYAFSLLRFFEETAKRGVFEQLFLGRCKCAVDYEAATTWILCGMNVCPIRSKSGCDEEEEAVVEGGEEIQGDALIPVEELRLVKRKKER